MVNSEQNTLTLVFSGVFALKAFISEHDLTYLLGFPYLVSDEEIEQYYTFCADSTNAKVKCESKSVIQRPDLTASQIGGHTRSATHGYCHR